jgi:hypothetical protein
MRSLGTKPDFLDAIERRIWKMVIAVACGEPAQEQLQLCLDDVHHIVAERPYEGMWFQNSHPTSDMSLNSASMSSHLVAYTPIAEIVCLP